MFTRRVRFAAHEIFGNNVYFRDPRNKLASEVTLVYQRGKEKTPVADARRKPFVRRGKRSGISEILPPSLADFRSCNLSGRIIFSFSYHFLLITRNKSKPPFSLIILIPRS